MKSRQSAFDFIEFHFENGEGMFVHAHAFRKIALSGHDTIKTLENKDGKLIESTCECMNNIRIWADEEKFFDPENLDIRHMFETSQEKALESFKDHIYRFRDVVSIAFYNSETKQEISYYVAWPEDEYEYTNSHMKVTKDSDYLSISIQDEKE